MFLDRCHGRFATRIAAALATIAFIVGSIVSAEAQPVNGRAFGIQGSVGQILGPIVNIPEEPVVTLPAGGGTAEDQTFNINNANGILGNLVSSGTLRVRTTSAFDAQGNPIPLNTGIYSLATIENLQIGGLVALLPSVLSAGGLSVSCQEGPNGLVGQMGIDNLSILGSSITTPPAPNAPPMTIQIAGITLGSLELNRQVTTTGPGGTTTLTVTGIHLELLTIPLLVQAADLTLLQASCTVSTPTTSSSIAPASGPAAGGTTVTITGTNFLQDASVTFGGTAATNVSVTSTTSLTAVTPAHAPGLVNVTVTTAGGTTSPPLGFTFIPAPTLTSLSPTVGPQGGGNTVTITGTDFGSNPAQVAVTFGGQAAQVTSVAPTTIQVIAPAAAAPGIVTVTVSAAGGTSGPLPYQYLPTPTLISINPSAGPVAGGNGVTLSGTNFGNAIAGVTVHFGGQTAVVTGVAPTTIAATVPAAAGPGPVQVTVTTGGGTTNPVAYAYVNGPGIQSITPNKGPATGGTHVTIIGENFAPGATVTFAGTSATNVVVVSASMITATTPPGPVGPASVVITSTGGTSTGAFTYVSTPQISGITPDQGTPGTVVDIDGGGFMPNGTVTICGQTVPFTFISATKVTFVAPPCANGGPQIVVLTNPDGGTATSPEPFTYLDDADTTPSITSVTPSAGPPAGGTNVIIRGTDFVAGAIVRFDGLLATNVVVVNPTTITATTPAHPLGVVPVSVETTGGIGTLPGAFTYRATLPPECAETFGLDPNDVDGDPDGDGQTNLSECTADPPSHPKGFHTRYLAEGAANTFFAMRLALFNTSGQPTTVLLQFQAPGFKTYTHIVKMTAHQRLTIMPTTLPNFSFTEFGTTMESDQQVVLDRLMTWDTASRFGSHAETAVAARSTTWYLAEGSTSDPFSLFYLLQNPQPFDTDVTIQYLTPNGAPPIARNYTLPPFSRTTIAVDNVDPALTRTDISAVVQASQQIVVERAMYMDQGGVTFAAGHEAAGVTAPATDWFLAEGATGPFFELFVLIANPNPNPATVQVDYLILGGQPVTKTYNVPSASRFTIWVDEEQFPNGSGNKALANVAVSTRLRSMNGQPIIVERAMWWPQPIWYEGHASAGVTQTGTLWALAEGEAGGLDSAETYMLIANTSDHSGQAQVTLYFEDGSTAAKVVALPATSRVNVQTTVDFPEAIGRRFAATVESLGPNPAAIVVERSMYTSPNAVPLGAGSNAVATKLQ